MTAILVLAGGAGSRLGGADKALLPLAGGTLLGHVLARLRGQGAPLLLSANGDSARFAAYGLPVLPDTVGQAGAAPAARAGPLAGVLAGLDWLAAHAPAVPDLLTVPTDTPFLPRDLAARLLAARAAADAVLACAASADRLHPVVAVWPLALAPALRAALDAGERRVGAFAAAFPRAIATYATVPFDPFLNVNTLENLAEAERLATGSAQQVG